MCAKNYKLIELLEKHPSKSIPVILQTMKKFLNDFINKKMDAMNGWKQECVRHWSKSLDHKSFNFKINERKYLATREFVNKIKTMMEQNPKISDPEKQKEALEFYTGFEGLEAKSLNLVVDPSIDPDNPMLLKDPQYLENFEKLPQFRFLMNDQDCLKLMLQFLLVSINNQSNHTKNKEFLISFTKYFFHFGFVQKNAENLKSIEMPDELLDLIKDTKNFYTSYMEKGFQYEEIFKSFFFEADNTVVVNIGTTRTDSFKEVLPMRPSPTDGIIEMDSDEESGEDKSSPEKVSLSSNE